jgi:hypothetical protein
MGKGTYNPLDVTEDNPLRVSKSSFTGYAKCPRRYWWDNIALADVERPSSPEAERGRAIHAVMEQGLMSATMNLSADIAEDYLLDLDFDRAADEHGVLGDGAVASLHQIIEAIAEEWGGLEIVEMEVKHEVPYFCVYRRQEEGVICEDDYDVILVGMIDAVFRMPDGSLCIVELKTGSANEGKLSRTRKELAYYRHLYEQVHGEFATHFLTIFPDADNPDFLTKMMNKRNTEVFMGMTQGLAVLEPVGTKTVNAMFNTLDSSIHGIMTEEWPIKWNEYFCTQWCDYHLSCNEQMLGVSQDVTMG